MSQLLLTELLTPDRIRIPLESRDKAGLIGELCEMLGSIIAADEREVAQIREAVLDREKVLSTGIGGGVAIPHGKSEALDDLTLVAGRTAEPVDFEALDGAPVRLVLLLVGPESAAGLHVKILSKISRLLRSESLRDELASVETPEEFHRVLREAEVGG